VEETRDITTAFLNDEEQSTEDDDKVEEVGVWAWGKKHTLAQ